jgi:hypothetical protein
MSTAGRRGRSEDEIRRDRAEVARRYCQGWAQARIGEALGLSQQQVSYDLAAVRKEWLASALQDFDERKAQELAKLDRLEAVAWEGWERSCRDAETFYAGTTKGRTTKEGAALPDLIKTHKLAKGQAGDPRFLERAGWCVERRCKILGLDAAQQHEHTVTVDERRDRLHRLLDSLRERGGTGGTGVSADGVAGADNGAAGPG